MVGIQAWTMAGAWRAFSGLTVPVPAILLGSFVLLVTPAQAEKGYWRRHDRHLPDQGRRHHHRPRWPDWNPGPPHKEIQTWFRGRPEPADPDACQLVLARGFAVVTRDGDRPLPGARYERRGTCPRAAEAER